MKALLAMAAALFAVATVWLWFRANPEIVTIQAEPLRPSAEIPVFRHVENSGPRDAR